MLVSFGLIWTGQRLAPDRFGWSWAEVAEQVALECCGEVGGDAVARAFGQWFDPYDIARQREAGCATGPGGFRLFNLGLLGQQRRGQAR
jgi:hypothetical protein